MEQDVWDNYRDPGDIMDNDHLRGFIEGIWRDEDDNDIRTIWNYFAAHSPFLSEDLPEYGDFGTGDYNFKYPNELSYDGETEVNVYLVGGYQYGGSANGNSFIIDMAGHGETIEDVPDWWYIHDFAGRTFCHEFQHTLNSCFDTGEDLEEAFAEVATTVAGCKKINVGYPHSDGAWPRYDLVYNSGIPRGIPYQDPFFAYQTNHSYSQYNKYTGFWLWTSYIFEQFPGPSSSDITDDLLYQVLRIADGTGDPLENMYAFSEAAANYSAPDWGFQDPDPALFHEIFAKWTIANAVDNKNFNSKYGYDIQDVRIRLAEDYGSGWLRDYEDGFCNNPQAYGKPPGFWCGHWVPELIEFDFVGATELYTLEGESDCYWDPVVGIELYSADYVNFAVNSGFPSNTILSLAFDVRDEDQMWGSNNILIQSHVVGYGTDENDIIFVQNVDMAQSDFPGYEKSIYHHVSDFGTSVNSIHTIVSSMENELGIDGQYPMRSYSIAATAVPEEEFISGTLYADAHWYHGQTINVVDDITIYQGTTLTIEPGVTVKVAAGNEILVAGTLDARGNNVYDILFTSDSSTPGDWVGIHTLGPDGVLLTGHCTVQYAEKGMAVATSQAHVFMNNEYRNCSDKALWLSNCAITGDGMIGGCTFEDNDYGVYMDNATANSFTGNSFTGNVTGIYMAGSAVLDADGFKDLYFEDNQYGIYMIDPDGAVTYLKDSYFEGHGDCAIYYNRQGGTGDLSMDGLTIIDGSMALNAGIRLHGGSTIPVLRGCDIRNFSVGFISPNIGISCLGGGMVDAGQTSDYGHNRFNDNDCDIQYANRLANPPWIDAVGNCWDDEYGSPEFCGKWADRIDWDPWDCSGWGGFGVPPRQEDPALAGLFRIYPNPQMDGVQIHFGIPEDEVDEEKGIQVSLSIFDLTGRLVRRLIKDHVTPGEHMMDWDGNDNSGAPASAGVYICRMETKTLIDSKRIVLIR